MAVCLGEVSLKLSALLYVLDSTFISALINWFNLDSNDPFLACIFCVLLIVTCFSHLGIRRRPISWGGRGDVN